MVTGSEFLVVPFVDLHCQERQERGWIERNDVGTYSSITDAWVISVRLEGLSWSL